MAAGWHRAPYPPPGSFWRRPLTPLEVGGLLVALALMLACCGGVVPLGVFGPPVGTAPVVYVTPTPSDR